MNCRQTIYILITLFLVSFVIEVSAGKSTIVPFGRPATVKFNSPNGKVYTYYSLAKGQSMGFAIEGPSLMEIRSRAGLTGDNVIAEYQIQIWEEEYGPVNINIIDIPAGITIY